MILKTLILQNFRKYKRATIEFPEGVIGIVGLNGSGKSTVFEAIAWVLYGSVAARTASEEIKYNGAEPSSVCLVDLCFHFEGDEYRVVRQMKGKNLVASATVTRNGKIAASGAGPSTTYIQKILGMDYKSFFTSIYAKQNELNTLSSLNVSERRPLILKMLGIDAVDDVIKQINSDKRTKSSFVAHLEKNLINTNGEKKESALLKKEKELKDQEQQTKKDISEMKKTKKQIKQEQKSLEGKIKEEKTAYEQINKKYESMIKQKIRYDKNQKIKEEITGLENKIKKRSETIETLRKKLNHFGPIEEDINQVRNRLESLHQSATEYIKDISKQNETLHQLEKQIKEINSKHHSIQNLGSTALCPTCERVLGSQFQILLQKYDKKNDKRKKERERIKNNLQKITEKQGQLKKEEEALKKKKEFLNKKAKNQQEVKIKLESHLNEMKNETKELDEKQKILRRYKEISFDMNEFTAIQEQRKNRYKQYQRIINDERKSKDTLSKQVLTLEKTQSHLALIQQQRKAVKKQRTELLEMEGKIDEEQKRIQELSVLKDIMVSFRLHLISRIRPALSQYASGFFHELTDGKYPEMTLDEQYNIHIYEDGEKHPIQRFSGGEIDLANLCLRLAISDVITERAQGLFQFIILDEIFGSQDRLRQQNIMQELYKLSATFKQIFLITHVEHVKHYVQHVIQIEDVDNESVASIN